MGRMENDDEDDDLVFLDDDLTWDDVSRASGAYETPHFTWGSRGRVDDDGSGPSRTINSLSYPILEEKDVMRKV